MCKGFVEFGFMFDYIDVDIFKTFLTLSLELFSLDLSCRILMEVSGTVTFSYMYIPFSGKRSSRGRIS